MTGEVFTEEFFDGSLNIGKDFNMQGWDQEIERRDFWAEKTAWWKWCILTHPLYNCMLSVLQWQWYLKQNSFPHPPWSSWYLPYGCLIAVLRILISIVSNSEGCFITMVDWGLLSTWRGTSWKLWVFVIRWTTKNAILTFDRREINISHLLYIPCCPWLRNCRTFIVNSLWVALSPLSFFLTPRSLSL